MLDLFGIVLVTHCDINKSSPLFHIRLTFEHFQTVLATQVAIALTAYAAAEDREKTLNAGFQAHLAKPAEPVELVAKVAILAGRGGPAGNTR